MRPNCNFLEPFLFRIFLLCSFFLSSVFIPAAEVKFLDLQSPSSELQKAIQKHGLKKIAVFPINDFTKLPRQFGRYISELLKVELSKNQTSFSVHELGGESPFNPFKRLMTNEELKEVGIEAFVDGNYIVHQESIELVIKLISIENRRILFSSRHDLARSTQVNEFLKNEFNLDWNKSLQQLLEIPTNSAAWGGLLIHFEKVVYIEEGDKSATVKANIILINTNKSGVISVAPRSTAGSITDIITSITNSKEETFSLEKLIGLFPVYQSSSTYYGTFMNIGAQERILTEWTFSTRHSDGAFAPFRFQVEMLIGNFEQGTSRNTKLHNFLIDLGLTN